MALSRVPVLRSLRFFLQTAESNVLSVESIKKVSGMPFSSQMPLPFTAIFRQTAADPRKCKAFVQIMFIGRCSRTLKLKNANMPNKQHDAAPLFCM